MPPLNTQDFDIEIRDIKTGRLVQKGLEKTEHKKSGSFKNMPFSRWLLFANSLATLALPFLPWLKAQYSCNYRFIGHHPSPCYTGSYGVDPILSFFYNTFIQVQPGFFFNAFTPAIIIASIFAFVSPGIFCSVWIHGPIRTQLQRIGAALFSLWFILFVTTNIYSIYWVRMQLHYQASTFGSAPSISWSYSIGFYLFIAVAIGYIVGLGLVWKEAIHTPLVQTQSPIRRQSLKGYLGAIVITTGIAIWFVNFYGLYWLLPLNCHDTLPIFASVSCWPRESTIYGLRQFFGLTQYTQSIQDSFFSFLFYGSGTISILGGIAISVASWLRKYGTTMRKWIVAWSILIGAYTTFTSIGMYQLSIINPQDRWTSAFPMTVLGLGLIFSGFLLRWERSSERLSKDHVIATETSTPDDTLKRLHTGILQRGSVSSKLK